MIRFLILAVTIPALFFSGTSYGQFYTTGEQPASVKWMKIRTAHFEVIFPSNLVNDAGMLANKLEADFGISMGDLSYPLRKRFPVLIQNTSVISNGYVALTPGRMELVMTPPQDLYAQDWLSQLTLHEFRHLAQLNRLDQGITRFFGWLTGEIARGVVSSQVPSWLYEGDAVYNETRLSMAGRGRNASFERPLRTLLTEKNRIWPYDKAMFGSYRDFVPDHYQYGYQLTSFARSSFGDDVWSAAFDYVSRHPYQVWPMSFYLKRRYGVWKQGLYHLAMDSLKQHYNRLDDNLVYDEYARLNKERKRVYTGYLHSKETSDGEIIAYKTGLDDPGTFVGIDASGRERKILITGYSAGIKTDIYGRKLIWDEVVHDPRWRNRSYSVIKKLDLETNTKRSLTRKTRYFSPSFSPDGSKIAVAENDIDNGNFLTIISAETGEVIKQISVADKVVQTPDWSDNEEIFMVTVCHRGKQLESVNPDTEEWTVHIPYTNEDIADPVGFEDYILFRGASDNTENIFAVTRQNPRKRYQVTRSRSGARYPDISYDKGQLLFSDYTADGFNIAGAGLDPPEWTEVHLSTGNMPVVILPSDTVDHHVYPAVPYRKAGHLFRVHSWLPFYANIDADRIDPMNAGINPGFTIFSQNMLGSAISSVSYFFTEGNHYFRPALIWRGWYPVVEISGLVGSSQPVYKIRSYIPLAFDRGAYTTYLQPAIEYERLGLRYDSEDGMQNGLGVYHLRFTAANYRRMSVRDLYPVWGQAISATYTGSVQDKGQFGYLYSLHGNLYFPGLFRHHHFFIRAGIQVQHPQRYFLPYIRADFPRGYTDRISQEFSSLMLNYSLPLLYPDLALGPIVYLKRFKTNLFYDIGYGRRVREPGPVVTSGRYESFGTELIADMHVIRFIFPVSAGIRAGYIPSRNKVFTELLLGVRLN